MYQEPTMQRMVQQVDMIDRIISLCFMDPSELTQNDQVDQLSTTLFLWISIANQEQKSMLLEQPHLLNGSFYSPTLQTPITRHEI